MCYHGSSRACFPSSFGMPPREVQNSTGRIVALEWTHRTARSRIRAPVVRTRWILRQCTVAVYGVSATPLATSTPSGPLVSLSTLLNPRVDDRSIPRQIPYCYAAFAVQENLRYSRDGGPGMSTHSLLAEYDGVDGFNWIELNWSKLDWIRMNWIGLNWIELIWRTRESGSESATVMNKMMVGRFVRRGSFVRITSGHVLAS